MIGQQAPDGALQARRILIVEDEWLVAMELQALVEQEGWVVLGPVNTVARALSLLNRERPDAALLDLNLDGQHSMPVAAALCAQRVPFAVVTGYGFASVGAPELNAAPIVEKPVDPQALLRLLSEMLSGEENTPASGARERRRIPP